MWFQLRGIFENKYTNSKYTRQTSNTKQMQGGLKFLIPGFRIHSFRKEICCCCFLKRKRF